MSLGKACLPRRRWTCLAKQCPLSIARWRYMSASTSTIATNSDLDRASVGQINNKQSPEELQRERKSVLSADPEMPSENSSLYTQLRPMAQRKKFDPIARAQGRTKQLPPSRYQFRPPKHYRGPLHPHQPPPASDPASREFIPGPFSRPRLLETYDSTIVSDLMALMYHHRPPGQIPPPLGDRVRRWDDSSPYHKNRGPRKPRGELKLQLADRDINFLNVPTLEKINVHAFVGTKESSRIPVASMVVQAITGIKAEVFKAKKSITAFELKAGAFCSVGAELRGEAMWDFFAKCTEIVMPRIKEWKGVPAKSGDNNGNINWGLDKRAVELFPEMEHNLDAYPPDLIPEIDIHCCTTATNDKDARLLLSALGIPFFGKHVN